MKWVNKDLMFDWLQANNSCVTRVLAINRFMNPDKEMASYLFVG